MRREEVKKGYERKRKRGNGDYKGFEECKMCKVEVGMDMVGGGWKMGLDGKYVIRDSWLRWEEVMRCVRRIGKGGMEFVGVGKLGKRQ